MKALVLKRYQNTEGYDKDLTTEDIKYLHQEIKTDFIKRIHTKIEGTWAEIPMYDEKKTWYELGDYQFLATRSEYKCGKIIKTVELSGVV